MGGHKSVQQMTMNIGPMFVFLRMYLIAVCLDVRRSGECGGAASPRPAAARVPTRCTVAACSCSHHVFSRLEDTVRYAHAIVDVRRLD